MHLRNNSLAFWGIWHMKAQSKPQKTSSTKQRKNYDYNKPIGKCVICYTLSGWHCYDCDNDFCQTHFEDHKEKQLCRTSWCISCPNSSCVTIRWGSQKTSANTIISIINRTAILPSGRCALFANSRMLKDGYMPTHPKMLKENLINGAN